MNYKIKFKQDYIGTYKLRNEYNIIFGKNTIGNIKFIKRNNIFIIGFLNIFEEYRNKHYGYEVINYILSHYKVNCIVGQTVYESRGFWNKCIKRFNGQRKNIVTCDNCSSSFVIPKYDIDVSEMKKLLNIGYDEIEY